MPNKRLSDLGKIQSMQDSDSIVVIVDGTEYLITKENFSKVLSILTTEQKSKLSTILLDGNGSKVLTDLGVYKTINNMFKQGQVNWNDSTKLAEINGYHTHNNIEVLDKLSSDGDTLFFNNKSISSYTLPVATSSILGGVKVDGTTITVSEDGTISGSSSYTLPTATNTLLGGVKVDGDTIKINNGVISADVNSAVNITEWEDSKDYTVNNLVIYENTIYKCNETHTSATEFDTTKWVGLTGAKGDKGDKGDDGFSPTLSYETTVTGVTVTMTDANDTHTFDLSNGTNGIDGKSAYEIAVDNNFEGTEQEWLESLNGENGHTPYIDSDTKHWIIDGTDTEVIAEARITNETGEDLVTKSEFNELYEIVNSANIALENVLNGGGNSE